MIQDIKDRVPVNVLSNDAIRYGIYDEQGNLIRYEYIKREDEPIEIGTPINRALFSNIQGDLHTQDRYNTPQVAYEPTMYGLVQKNIIPNEWTQTSNTEATANDGTKLSIHYWANDVGSGTHLYPFDGVSTTAWTASRADNAPLNSWIKLEFVEATKITKMKTFVSDSRSGTTELTSWEIQGSNDDAEWVDLFTSTVKETELTEHILNNPDFYKYYRIYITMPDRDYNAKVFEWQVSEYEGYDYGYVNKLSLPLTSYEVGKIVRIKGSSYTDGEGTEITSFENSYININNLGIIPVKGTIYKNNYYNLVFDGAQFLLESSRIDVTNATILVVKSGTYTLNPDITYDVVAIGGGGGSWMDTDDCTSYGGGSGGYVTGTISNTSSIDVTIGAGGKNVVYYRPWQQDAGDGGSTIVGNLIAYGGTGASSLGPSGTGGSYSGGQGQDGTNGNYIKSTGSGYINGPTPTGWNLNGTKGGMYGAGGQIESEGGYDGGRTIYHGQNGVVAFIPQV